MKKKNKGTFSDYMKTYCPPETNMISPYALLDKIQELNSCIWINTHSENAEDLKKIGDMFYDLLGMEVLEHFLSFHSLADNFRKLNDKDVSKEKIHKFKTSIVQGNEQYILGLLIHLIRNDPFISDQEREKQPSKEILHLFYKKGINNAW